MPVIQVFGVPETTTELKLKNFWVDIRSVIEKIPEFGLNQNEVSVFFPKDLLQEGLGEEIIIVVTQLFKKPERTEKARNKFAKLLGKVAKKHFPAAKIEASIYTFNPKQGFWSSEE